VQAKSEEEKAKTAAIEWRQCKDICLVPEEKQQFSKWVP
jgi:hypothetical protein